MRANLFPAASRIAGVALAVLAAAAAGPVLAGDYVRDQPGAGRFPLVGGEAVADIFVDADDWKVARIAARDLASDVERVTGRRPVLKHASGDLAKHAVVVGTIGRSPVIDRLIKTGRLDVILTKITDFYTREINNIISNLMTLMEPIIIILIGIGVGTMVAAIILPMYQMADSF